MAYVIGLRNSNSLEKNPETGEFWVADQGGDAGGDELNVLVRRRKDYGWPYVSYGRMGGTKPVGTGLDDETRDGAANLLLESGVDGAV